MYALEAADLRTTVCGRVLALLGDYCREIFVREPVAEPVRAANPPAAEKRAQAKGAAPASVPADTLSTPQEKPGASGVAVSDEATLKRRTAATL